ncbi:hypothetical protein THAR02_09570 [Trichoderma harzianum]|uniref:Uncharacterized protein n=1 Tax=Trichoderma harzianum TaxID=5544 RepID=A0A0F9ZYM2_TRIHA|nr:hypothetical protein THAR02_09570 [Trichoderma harzianum]
MADERDSTASGASHFMRPWTAAHHHDDALPLQLTTFALCATHLEPRVSFCTGTFARAEPPQACRIRPGTVRYGTSTALGCAAKLLPLCYACLHRRPTRLALEAAWRRRTWDMGLTEPGKLPCRQVESSRTPGPKQAVTTVIVPAHRRPVFDSGCCFDGNSGPKHEPETELTGSKAIEPRQ